MTLISSSLPNFVNGVSQQPYTLRLPSQGEHQENGLSTVSSGLRKRPPTEHLAKIGTTPLAGAFVHLIDRDGAEQYQVVIAQNALKVYDLTGNAKVVNGSNFGYLTTAQPPQESFAMTTVADYSFIVNKAVAVRAATALSPGRPFEALVNVKLGNYGKTYAILINGIVAASYATPDGSAASQSPLLSTDAIAAQLVTALAVTGYTTFPWGCTARGSVIHITKDGTDFQVTTTDGFSGNAMVAIKGSLQKFSDLPSNPRVDGFTVRITGEQASPFDNYWVRFDSGGGADSVGVWRESVAPYISTGLDALTMPHVLIREADGTFTFRPAVWTPRVSGDATTNPHPSFVNSRINDVFFFQNRLGFLSDENFIQTETGKYFNCYRTTVATLLDSDPIDVNAATNKVAVLEHALAFNKQLLLFTKQQQFVIDSAELLTPKRVPIKPTTDFSVNTRAKPVASGRNVYFTMDKGAWTSAREYFVDLNNLTNDASDVTAHVPMYVPSGVTKIAAGVSEDVVVMLSENDRSKLYVYKFHFSGNEKLQSSWSTFSLGGTILSCDFIRSVLYLVISREDGLYFEKMDFSVGASTVGEPYQVRLDRKVQVATGALSYDGTHTTISPEAIGYLPNDGEYMVVTNGGGGIKPGQVCGVIHEAGVTKIQGDFTTSPLTLGKRYMFRYTLSPLAVRFPQGGTSRAADTEGRTQVRRIAFNHADTGFYTVKVTPLARQAYTYIFSGKVLGTPSATVGVSALSTGRLNVPVMSRNTQVAISIESDMPLPVSIYSADWEAFYVKRNQSV